MIKIYGQIIYSMLSFYIFRTNSKLSSQKKNKALICQTCAELCDMRDTSKFGEGI